MTAQDQPSSTQSSLTCEEMENFLRTAKIVTQRETPKGVTRPKRATLDDGKMRHDASIQTIHESKARFETMRGVEMNFKDWWEFNVAGYELAKMLELNMVPPYVERKLPGQPGSLSWWIPDSMLELERKQKKLESPDLDTWNKEMYLVRVFDQLIANMDPNLTNFIIDKNWHVWMIDFSRAFRMTKDLPSRKDLVQCDRKLLANLRKLDKATLKARLGKYLTGMEIDGLLARRDKIVKFFEDEIAAKGEGAVLFDLPRVGRPCGTGL
jgi:hypothetical protein